MRRLGQSEGNEGVAEFFFSDFGVAASGNHQVLLAGGGHPVGHGRGVAARGKLGLPQFLAGFGVERAKMAVGRSRDKHEAASSYDGSAEADGAGWDLRMFATEIAHGA